MKKISSERFFKMLESSMSSLDLWRLLLIYNELNSDNHMFYDKRKSTNEFTLVSLNEIREWGASVQLSTNVTSEGLYTYEINGLSSSETFNTDKEAVIKAFETNHYNQIYDYESMTDNAAYIVTLIDTSTTTILSSKPFYTMAKAHAFCKSLLHEKLSLIERYSYDHARIFLDGLSVRYANHELLSVFAERKDLRDFMLSTIVSNDMTIEMYNAVTKGETTLHLTESLSN